MKAIMTKFHCIKYFWLVSCLLTLLCSMLSHAQPVDTVDILVLYTKDAEATAEGHDINARIAAYIAHANQVYLNSGVKLKLRLIGSNSIESIDPIQDYTILDEKTLRQLQSNAQVSILRRNLGADIVTLLTQSRKTSQGNVCGTGYQIQGDASTGKLSPFSYRNTYNLVAIDCDLNTFIHEVGHNMSLGHSSRQSGIGGVHTKGRGYGVDGLYSTVMAYPHLYGTYTQLARLSNPQQNTCLDTDCGHHQHDDEEGNDAADTLNQLSKQLANLFPSITGDNNNAQCEAAGTNQNEKNLLASVFSKRHPIGNREKIRSQSNPDNCKTYLEITNRAEYYDGVKFPLTGIMAPEKSYRIQGQFRIRNSAADYVRLALKIQDNTGVHFQYLPAIVATSDAWIDYQEEITIRSPSVENIELFTYGPSNGIDILIESLTITVQNQSSVNNNPKGITEDFENSALGWAAFWGGEVRFSRDSSEGIFSLVSENRTSRLSGIVFDASGTLQTGAIYRISADVKITTEETAEPTLETTLPIQISAFMSDNTTSHWESVTQTEINKNQWQRIEGRLFIDNYQPYDTVRLHIFGAPENTKIHIDNIEIGQ